MSPWFPCPEPHTVGYLCFFPNPVAAPGAPGAPGSFLLLPTQTCRCPVVGLQKCTVAFSISPRQPDLTMARDQTSIRSIHQPTCPPRGASCTGPSSSLVMLLMSKMHWTGLNRVMCPDKVFRPPPVASQRATLQRPAD